MYGYGYAYLNNPQGNGLLGRYEAGVRSDGGSFAFPIDTGLASRLEGLGLLNASSLVNSCNAGKESVLYNLVPTPVQALDRFTVARAGTKWVLGANGLLTEVQANVPAFEYNADGTYRGLLVEPAGTNLFLQSQTISVSPWSQVIAGAGVAPVITATAGTAPNGTNTGTRIQLNAGGVTINDRSIWRQAVTIVNATTYTCSIWVRATSAGVVGNTVRIAFEGTSPIATTTHTLTLGWQRISVTGLSNTTSGQILIECRGTVTGQTADLLAWGAQLETGSVATSYIPTVASTANRVADSVTLTGASSLIGQTEGTLYAEVEARKFTSTGDRRVLNIRVDGSNVINLSVASTSGAYNFDIINGGASQVAITSSAIVGTIDRLAAVYKVNDFALYINGTLIGTDASGTVPNVTTGTIGLGIRGDGAASTQLNGWIRSAVLFTTRLPNATLASLTA